MDGEGKKTITSYDVARLAGVSQSAVSRAFSPNASVSAKVRDRVFEAARQLNYVPNRAARSLIQGQSDIVGVMLSDLMVRNFPNIVLEFSRTLEEQNKRMLLFSNEPEANVEAEMMTALSYQLDGLICAHSLPQRVHDLAVARKLPVVLFNREAATAPNQGIMSVRCDHFGAGEALAGQVLSAGAERVLLITGPTNWPVSSERIEGLLSALDGRVAVTQTTGDYSYESGWSAVETAVRGSEALPFDTVVGVNDPMAIGALDCLRSVFGVSVPSEVQVAGFDDAPASKRVVYDLCSMRQPVGEMVRTAVELVAGDREAENVMFQTEFIQRSSLRIKDRA